MFSKRRNTVFKVLLLATTAVLVAGFSAASPSWNNPSSDGQIFGTNDVTLNVTESTAGYVHFWIKNSDESNYTSLSNETSGTNNFYTYETTSKGDGTYDFKANNSDGSAEITDVVFDTQKPQLDSKSPTGYTSETDPTVSVDTSDNGDAGVNYTFLNVTDSEDDNEDSTVGESLDLEDLNDETYTVDYSIFDKAGNKKTGSWDFTVDTSYDGDTSPDLPDEEYILLDEDDEYDFEVELSEEDEGSDITVTCYDGNDDEIDSETQSVSGDTTFTCEVDGDDYSDTETDIYVEMCDQAGNCKESDTETYFFDGSPPSLFDLSIPGSTVNSDFPVEFTATDVSGIDKLEYFYESSVDEGDGNTVNVSDSEGEFSASVSGLDEGEQTIYIRAKDNAGRWSDPETIDFTYDPDATPEISLAPPSNLSVTAGDSESFDVTLENTGDIFIDETNLSVAAEGVVSDSSKVSDMEPGDTLTLGFGVETDDGDLGEYDVTVSLSYPEISKSFPLVVEANQDQQQELEANLSTYEEKLSKLQSDFSSNKDGWGDDLKQRFESNFSSFKQKVEDAQKARDSGEYYRISSALEGIDADYSAAEKSFENVKKIDSRRDLRRMVMIGFGLFVVVIGGVGGFLYWSDDYNLDLDKFFDSDIDIRGLDDIMARIRTMTGEEEAEEFEWDGFKDY